MKTYTDIEQSKKLAEILPIESADMYYLRDVYYPNAPITAPRIGNPVGIYTSCWSLAALLNVLPKIINNETLFIETSAALWHIGYRNIYIARADNPIDACVEMIIKLHKKGLI